MSKVKGKIAKLKTAYPLNPKAIVEASAEYDALANGLAALEALETELGLEGEVLDLNS